ncbi:phospholipase [Streptomyces pluripotens]|uniref:phospholipase C n=1 Tax=Streptomyces pluripotens TaxID=1355015 RepID=A0A221NSG8_9ACTN|nr:MULTISPECIES: alkaline phosphatase family protein [Streptomyces]ARP68687.1 phospholipase [Streptomyces pluripotens]ASN22943.1 phospholipase [Streptomyces pluripotens]KIE26688.1 phospholipase C [Streptomyces sp. MUSC 125]MCH0559216.1 alkaline phosphatase family protein [Streptomyces sp. MUM 16J]
MASRGRRTAMRSLGALAGAAALTALGSSAPGWAAAPSGAHHGHSSTRTPIKHVVVLFDENISFDHYFATYPKAANTDGTKFKASKKTPKHIDTLAHAGLLKKNPNQYAPKRLSPSQAMTCDQNHSYGPEQYAANHGRADQYVQNTEVDKCSGGLFGEPGLVMDYYDGNTVTALWNYAQHYALNDRSFSSTYGPSTPGALNLVSGQTHGVISVDPTTGKQTATPDSYTVKSPDAKGVGTVVNDPDPAYDDCSGHDHTSSNALAAMQGRNIGDLLNTKKVTWGWFQGGFRPSTAWNGKAGFYAKCDTTHTNVGGAAVTDYSPHHNPFAYYKSTANPHHLAPKSVSEIGHNGRANHNYDLTDFSAALKAGKLPAVSFVKAGAYQDGHAGYSDPIDEQHFLVKQINAIQSSPQWKSTAIVIAYDDSDGWYDHAYVTPRNGSKDTSVGSNGKATDSPACRKARKAAGGYADRCGPGTRQPLLVISRYSKVNKVDHTLTDQASITRFIEDNWCTGRIGDHSFDAKAGSLRHMFDFRHPHNKQVLLNMDGSVKHIGPIRHVAAVTTNITPGPSMQDTAATTDASRFPTLTVGLGVGALLAAGVTGTYLTRRRRQLT